MIFLFFLKKEKEAKSKTFLAKLRFASIRWGGDSSILRLQEVCAE